MGDARGGGNDGGTEYTFLSSTNGFLPGISGFFSGISGFLSGTSGFLSGISGFLESGGLGFSSVVLNGFDESNN